MARVYNNPLLKGARGKLGNVVVYKQYGYGTVMSKYPDMTRVIPSEAQLKQRDRFRRATAYAKAMLRQPEKVEQYKRLATNGQQLKQMAIQEYYRNEKSDPPSCD